ncbi:MAG TPA: sugar transferase [Gaiellaceae bacterium]|nr:sugar transferase [Gaiellaceae bacterium]
MAREATTFGRGLPRASAAFEHRALFDCATRALDVLLALLFLVAFSPVILLAIVAIRLETPGPALYRQERMGRKGRIFSLLKLRGMYIDAPQRFPSLYDHQATAGEDTAAMYFHRANDPRLTNVGRFLRKHSFDELPNFWNVLLGDMSIVGPRPEIPELAHLYGSSLGALLSVRPGITSPSKARGRDMLSFEETLARDLEYVRNRSLALNVRTIAETALTAFRGVGVR